MSTKSGPISGLRPVRFRWSSTTMTDPGGEVVTDASGGRGEDHGAAAGGDTCAQGMDHLHGGQSFVQVAPTAQDEDPKAVVVDRPRVGSMPSCRVGREEGQCVERDGLLTGAQDLGRPGEPAPEEHEHVVVVDPQAAGQFPGAVRRPVGGGLHGADRRGSYRRPAHNIGRTCPPRPLPPPCTRWRPSTGDEIIAAREIVFASGRAEVPERGPALRLHRPVRAPQGNGARAWTPVRTWSSTVASAWCFCRDPRPTWSRSSCR